MKRVSFLALAVLTAAALAAGWGGSHSVSADPVRPAASMTPEQRDAVAHLKTFSDGFAAIAEAVIPSVVTITSERIVQPAENPLSMFNDPFFRRFFGDSPQLRQPGPQRQRGLGSGVIVAEDGKILTNHHVIRGADELTVILSDGRRLQAEVVGSDPRTDLAVLRVEADDLPAIRFGDSESLRIGEWVLAVGSPFSENLQQTISAGIVSGLGRSGMRLNDYEDFIQTDAAINPGNSGGALVNLDGELVGVNSAIVTRAGGFNGVGFAIPANQARRVMLDLIRDGKVHRGWLGVRIQDLTEDLAAAMDLPGTDGILVNSVEPGSPAEEAGVRQGDVIVSLGGKAMDSVHELRMRVADLEPGTRHELVVVRDGRRETLKVRLGVFPEEGELAQEDGAGAHRESLGLTVEPVTPDLARRFNLEDSRGLVVTSVTPGGPAEDAGIQPGDIVKKVNRRPVESISDYRSGLGSGGDDQPVLFLMERGGGTFFVALRPEK